MLTVDDYKSKNYIDVFDAFDIMDISLRYGSDTWTKVFSGPVTTTSPRLSMRGEVLDVGAWEDGIALWKTSCDESYGVESIDNNAVVTPKQIIEDLINNHINKVFGGAASGWLIGNAQVDNVHAGLSVTFLNSQYDNNFVNINRVCDLASAYAQGLGPPQVGVHWYVDVTGTLYVKKIDADHSSGGWDRYWGGTSGTDPGTQASSTIVVKEDMILYDFKKNVEEYANHIVLSSKWRNPSEDYWTEDNGGQALWGTNEITKTNDATSIVGSHSLKLVPTGNPNAYVYYPAGQAAAWDFTKCGSENTVPSLNVWLQKNDNITVSSISLCTAINDYYIMYGDLQSILTQDDVWIYLNLPIGEYHYGQQEQTLKRWVKTNNADWSNINWLQIDMPSDNTLILYVDDLHFTGLVVREALDAAEIAANKTYMKVIRNDVAVNDTLKQADDSGTAAQLAYAELLRRSQTPIVGKIQIPLAVDMLPGQTVHIHACEKADGTFRIDSDMRVKELTHNINSQGFMTVLNLTDDVTNSHAFAVPDAYALLRQYAGALGQSEARDLKGGALDNRIPRLTVSY